MIFSMAFYAKCYTIPNFHLVFRELSKRKNMMSLENATRFIPAILAGPVVAGIDGISPSIIFSATSDFPRYRGNPAFPIWAVFPKIGRSTRYPHAINGTIFTPAFV